jgi:hypothetical protein
MHATRNLSGWVKVFGIASLFGLMLTACGKRDETEAPVATVQQSAIICRVPHAYASGELSKYDEDLFAASAAGDVHRVEQSIDEGAHVNATGLLKRTPLFAAAFCDRPAVAAALIDKGSQVNVKDANGMAPLHAAVIIGGAGTVNILIGKGADINIRDPAGRTPLHVAAATGQIALVELLLERGTNAIARDRDGLTAASLASENGHAKLGATIRKWREKHMALRQK